MISIHALRVEGDFFNFCRAVALKISIHALRVEGDKLKNCPPVTGVYFYPRPPGGGRHVFFSQPAARRGISIHALRVEGDRLFFCKLVRR